MRRSESLKVFYVKVSGVDGARSSEDDEPELMDAVRDVVERAGGRIVAVADEPSTPLFPALAVRSSRASSPSSTSKAFAHHLRRPSRPPELFVGAPDAFAASPPRARRSEWDAPPRRARDRTSAPCSPGTPRATRVSRDRAQTPLELPRVTATSCASVVGGAGRASGVLGAGAAFVAGNGEDRAAAARASHVVRYRGEEEEGGEEGGGERERNDDAAAMTARRGGPGPAE